MKTKLIILTVTVLFTFCSATAFAGDRWHNHQRRNQIIHKIYNRFQDRFCNSVEPEPEPSAAAPSLKVYDADDQDLGVFVDRTYSSFETLIPGLNKVIGIRKDDGSAVSIHYGDAYFDGENCSGNAYTYSVELYDIISYNAYDYLPERFLYTSIDPVPQEVEVLSRYTYGARCIPISLNATMYRIIEIPEGDIPFSFPASVPLQLKYE